jgi:hypothetical protein
LFEQKLSEIFLFNLLDNAIIEQLVTSRSGRAVAEAASRWLPTAAARVQVLVRSCWICGGQSGAGAGFLRVLRFPLPSLIPPTAPHSSGAGTIRQLVADVPIGLSLTPPQETKKNTTQ